jgi:hypothetical protein
MGKPFLMKTKCLLASTLLLTCLCYGQDDSLPDGMSVGFSVSEIQNDFGVGLDLATPYFLADRIGFRARGNLRWLEHIGDDLETTWTPYAQFSLGVVAVAREFSDVMRLYAEGGVIGIVPNEEFSNESFELGGYGLFGFEFFIVRNLNYYMEVGGVGTSARANEQVGNPIYSNGLSISGGFRVQL